MMDVIIIANFVGALDGGKNSRFSYLAEKLAQLQNVSVELISSSFSHDNKKKRNEIPKDFNFSVKLIDEPGYKKNVCLERFYSHYVWGKSVIKYLKGRKKPDVVYCAVPSLTGPNEVAKYCNKNNIPFIIDIQDLWPEAFQMVFNVPIVSNIIFTPFNYLANNIYKHADVVCAVSDTYVNRALKVNKNVNKGYTVFLGTELKTFDKNTTKEIVVEGNNTTQKRGVQDWDRVPEKIEKRKNEIWLAYCGTLGSSYDLTTAIKAVSMFNQSEYDVKFIVMGSGPKSEEFIECARKENINEIFTGNLNYSDMCSILVKCDININPISSGAAQSIINKHADYAASGLPVISTQESEEYRRLVSSYEMGFNCNNNDVADLFVKIELLVKDEELRKSMGKNARRCAEERFDRAKTYSTIIKLILDSKNER